MIKDKSSIWSDAMAQQFAEALLDIESLETLQAFLRDIMTNKELTEMGARLEAAKMLKSGAKYLEITKQTKLSSRTIARISTWLKDGCGGYASVLNKVKTHHSHIPPVSAA